MVRSRFQAGIHGIDLDKALDDTVKESTTKAIKKIDNSKSEEKTNPFMFRDPEEYKSMSPEERESLTKNMMGFYRNWAEKTPL